MSASDRRMITLSPPARAQVEKGFIKRTIAEAWEECQGHLACHEARAQQVVWALEEAGFIIVRKPSSDGQVAA